MRGMEDLSREYLSSRSVDSFAMLLDCRPQVEVLVRSSEYGLEVKMIRDSIVVVPLERREKWVKGSYEAEAVRLTRRGEAPQVDCRAPRGGNI
jgi:hypothetical protein